MCTSEECGACAGGGVRIANRKWPMANPHPSLGSVLPVWPLAIGRWKCASNHFNNAASYTARDAALWKCLLGFCPVVPLEWNTVVRSSADRHERLNSLKAEVGAAGMSVHRATAPGRTPRASHKRR